LKKFDAYKAAARKPIVLDHQSFTPTRVNLENKSFEPTRETLDEPSFGPSREVFEAGKSLQANQLQRRKMFEAIEQKASDKAAGKTQFGTQKQVAPTQRRKSFDVLRATPKKQSQTQQIKTVTPEEIPASKRRKKFR